MKSGIATTSNGIATPKSTTLTMFPLFIPTLTRQTSKNSRNSSYGPSKTNFEPKIDEKQNNTPAISASPAISLGSAIFREMMADATRKINSIRSPWKDSDFSTVQDKAPHIWKRITEVEQEIDTAAIPILSGNYSKQEEKDLHQTVVSWEQAWLQAGNFLNEVRS